MWVRVSHDVCRRFQSFSSSSRYQLNIWISESLSRIWISVLFNTSFPCCLDVGGKRTVGGGGKVVGKVDDERNIGGKWTLLMAKEPLVAREGPGG